MKQKIQMSETFLVGIILAFVGGFLDVYTYICRGGVFANAQTGNIVLLGIKLAQGKVYEGLYYLIPILAFAFGIIIAEIIRKKFKTNLKLHWRQIIIFFEILILLIVSFIPISNSFNLVTNVMISFVCSLQVQSFRKMKGNAFATTMCTGNLRSATEHLYVSISEKNKDEFLCFLQYFGIIVFFIIGAVFGVFFTNIFQIRSILFACLGLLIVFILMLYKKN